MPDSFAQFTHKLDKVTHALGGSQLRVITTKVALKSKPILSAAIEPPTLSHWGKGGRKGGYKVAAKYDLVSDHEVKMRPTQAALGALLERGSGNTWKAPKRKGSKRRSEGSVGTYTRAKVPARRAWSKGVAKLEPEVPKFVREEVQRVLRETFGV